jgi:hypothetical protein
LGSSTLAVGIAVAALPTLVSAGAGGTALAAPETSEAGSVVSLVSGIIGALGAIATTLLGNATEERRNDGDRAREIARRLDEAIASANQAIDQALTLGGEGAERSVSISRTISELERACRESEVTPFRPTPEASSTEPGREVTLVVQLVQPPGEWQESNEFCSELIALPNRHELPAESISMSVTLPAGRRILPTVVGRALGDIRTAAPPFRPAGVSPSGRNTDTEGLVTAIASSDWWTQSSAPRSTRIEPWGGGDAERYRITTQAAGPPFDAQFCFPTQTSERTVTDVGTFTSFTEFSIEPQPTDAFLRVTIGSRTRDIGIGVESECLSVLTPGSATTATIYRAANLTTCDL